MLYFQSQDKVKILSVIFWLTLFICSLVLSLFITTMSFFSYLYFFALWGALVFSLYRDHFLDFTKAYLVGALVTIVFFLFQISAYPDSYGTTHPLGSWSDDSFFFALMADILPPGLYVRDFYYEYDSFFSILIRSLTPFHIGHPSDVVFFLAGVLGILAVFTYRLALRWISDTNVARIAYWMTVFSPLYWMFGGSILIRDTLIAAFFVYIIDCLYERRQVLALLVFSGLFALRPGSALLALALIAILFFREIFRFNRIVPLLMAVAGSITALWLYQDFVIVFAMNLISGTSEGGAISLVSREFIVGMGEGSGEEVLSSVQDLPFPARLLLNGFYMFLFPFFTWDDFMFREVFDLRYFLLSGIVPILGIFLNTWFFSGMLTKNVNFKMRKLVLTAFLFGLVFIGTYSMQGRHTLLLMPFYYIICAYGLTYSIKWIKYICLGLAVILFVVQALR